MVSTNRRNTNKYIDQAGFISSELKRKIVSRMFWGRSSLYKNLVHFLVIVITITVTLSGIIYRVSDVSASGSVLSGEYTIGSNDLLSQGGSITTVLRTDNTNLSALKNRRYVVQQGDTLESIAKSFNISMDTIRWANPNLISPFTNDIQVGWDLAIPEINGVLYAVRPGQTLEEIISLTNTNNDESNLFNIVELNQLTPPYNLTAGTKLFIPDGNLFSQTVAVEGIPRGVFTDPLSSPDCAGYLYQRGFTYYHDGVDLSKWDGCTISAVANGRVYYAGWENMSGLTVKIDHGGGIHTYYYHLRDIYVKVGDRVQQGGAIGYMGSTGNSTGTHLHFVLKKDFIAVDPEPYVPYNK
jgi:murein DD-endopeptidase MepM/ murein hydrolase activator NlpD